MRVVGVDPVVVDAPTVITAGSYTSTNGFTDYRETLGLTSYFWISGSAWRRRTAPAWPSGLPTSSQVALDTTGDQVALGKVPIKALAEGPRLLVLVDETTSRVATAA